MRARRRPPRLRRVQIRRAPKPVKLRARHVRLPADFEQFWNVPPREALRQVPQNESVARYVVALRAVAAREKPREPSALVYGGNPRPVHFRLHAISEPAFRSQGFVQARVELFELGGIEHVVEALHRRDVGDRRERFREVVSDSARRRRLVGELRIFFLQLPQPAHKYVEIVVGNYRRVFYAVQPLVLGYLRAKAFYLRLGRVLVHMGIDIIFHKAFFSARNIAAGARKSAAEKRRRTLPPDCRPKSASPNPERTRLYGSRAKAGFRARNVGVAPYEAKNIFGGR